jgi:hypothetical protein
VTQDASLNGIRLTALSGRRGRPVWSVTVPAASVEYDPWIGHFLPGSASDFVEEAETDNPKHTIVQPIVVDGSNGAVRRLPRIRTSLIHEPGYSPPNPARMFAVSDLDGDGLADLLFAAQGGPASGLTAETATTGRTIWHKAARHMSTVTDATSVGRLGLGTVSNLAIGSYATTKPFGRQQSLLDGSTGHTIWTRPGDQSIRIDRAGSHLLPAVGVIRWFPASTSYSGGHRVGVVAKAIGVDDRVLWTRSLIRPSRQLVDPGDAAQGFDVIDGGDVEPDGAHEIQVSLDGLPGKHGFISGLIDGRTGKLLPNVFGVPADGSFTSSPGTDSVGYGTRTGSDDKFSVGARDGLTNRLYFSRILKVPTDALAVPIAARVTPKCSSVGLITFTGGPQVDAIYSGAGHLLWKLTYGASREFGGTLVRGKPSKRYCAQ